MHVRVRKAVAPARIGEISIVVDDLCEERIECEVVDGNVRDESC